jgi:hypothetical protein
MKTKLMFMCATFSRVKEGEQENGSDSVRRVSVSMKVPILQRFKTAGLSV